MRKMSLNNIPVGAKLGTGFAIVVLLAILLIILGMNSMDNYHMRSQIVAEASSAESFLLDARVEEKNYQIRKQVDYVEQSKDLADRAVDTLVPLKELFVVPADVERVDRIAAGVEK